MLQTLPAMPSPASSLSIYSTHPVLPGEVTNASSPWNFLGLPLPEVHLHGPLEVSRALLGPS